MFTRTDNMLAHRKTHSKPDLNFPDSKRTFSSVYNLNLHQRTQHRRKPVSKKVKPTQVATTHSKRALNTFTSQYFYPVEEIAFDVLQFKQYIKSGVSKTIH